ncbi:hypothetical protein MmTuc01_3267 [Methanosarcina mazei Tuc01]|jgi:hypothetical protein|uniref:Uncharacterized protein n=1 Tax=Methanosarcina mazei Tuc01 TaxID=1236903 RepID=M1QND5_METMZ|nr:hypothetical protein MmTuc01_3267 [Methanosarcina mazei Tuc01]
MITPIMIGYPVIYACLNIIKYGDISLSGVLILDTKDLGRRKTLYRQFFLLYPSINGE